eukprot:3001600-Rhodomonas_salina.4
MSPVHDCTQTLSQYRVEREHDETICPVILPLLRRGVRHKRSLCLSGVVGCAGQDTEAEGILIRDIASDGHGT